MPEAVYEGAHQKARDARLSYGFDPATPWADDGAEGADGGAGALSKKVL